jgi:hypothetical protein
LEKDSSDPEEENSLERTFERPKSKLKVNLEKAVEFGRNRKEILIDTIN